MEVGEKRANKKFSIPRKERYCSRHMKEVLNFYCKTCEEITCRNCVILNHKDHLCGDLDEDELADNSFSHLKTSLEECDEIIAALDAGVGKCEKMIQSIQSHKKAVDKEIKNVFDMLMKAVAKRQKELLDKNEEIAIGKVSKISIQAEGFAKLKNQAMHGRRFANNVLLTHQANELLSTKKVIEGQLERCKSNFSKLPRDPQENSHVGLMLEYSSIVDSIMQFGMLMVVDPASCMIEAGTAVPLATVGKERKLKLSLRYRSGTEITESVPLEALVKSSNGREIPVTVSTELEDDPSRPTLTFTPDMTGEHELSVMVTGTRIQSSPYRVWVRQERDPSTVGGAQQHFNVGNIGTIYITMVMYIVPTTANTMFRCLIGMAHRRPE